MIVLQASGAMLNVEGELKKAASAFVNGLGEKDQVAVVTYGDSAETIAPFSPDKGDVAGKIAKITMTGKSFLLFDGLAQAISLFSASPGKGQAATGLPAPKAINGQIQRVSLTCSKPRIRFIGSWELTVLRLPNRPDFANSWTAGSATTFVRANIR